MNFWLILFFVCISLLACCFAVYYIATKLLRLMSTITAMVSLVYIVVMLFVAMVNVKTFERQYFNYIQLRLDIQEADMSEPLINYDISKRVYDYNLWLEKNEDDFNNFWSIKYGLKYTNQFDYIEIKGD